MLIRSQNKKSLVILDNLTDIRVTGKHQIMATYPGEDMYDFIGDYSSEANAIKVLDMICDAYTNACYTDKEYNGAYYATTIIRNNTVFQMPSDSIFTIVTGNADTLKGMGIEI